VKLSSNTPQTPKEWTVLIYNATDTNMVRSATAHLLDLEAVGSDAKTDIVCLNNAKPWIPETLHPIRAERQGTLTYHVERVDNPVETPNWVPSEWKSAAKFCIASPDKVQSQPINLVPVDADPAKPETLEQFLKAAIKQYPAKHYALIFSGHGGGLAGQAVIGKNRLTNEVLAKTIDSAFQQSGAKLDLLNLDTCYGANLEVLHPLANVAETIVGSQGIIAMATQPIKEVVQSLQASVAKGESVSGPELGQLFVEASRYQDLANFHVPTLSAVNGPAVLQVSDAVSQLHQRILDKKIDPSLFSEALKKSEKLDYSAVPRKVSVWDLGSLANTLAEVCPDPDVKADAANLAEAVKGAVIAEQHGEANKETLLTRVARLPIQSTAEEHPGLTGISLFYDPELQTSGSRLPLLAGTELSSKLKVEQFFDYISQDYRAEKAQQSTLSKAVESVKTKVASVQNKINKAIKIPYVGLALNWGVRVGVTVAASMALGALGLPVAQLAGAMLVGQGAIQAFKSAKNLVQHSGETDLVAKEARVDQAKSLGLSTTLGAFGLSLMGVLPAPLGWPLAGGALATHAAAFLAKSSVGSKERSQFQATQANFHAAQTVHEKLQVSNSRSDSV
jgi:hypothetical protein